MIALPMNLSDLGWSKFFDSQIHSSHTAQHVPARVMAVHRGEVEVIAPDFYGQYFRSQISSFIEGASHEEEFATVGDWVLLNTETKAIQKVLNRHSLFKRRAAGKENKTQLIAANVDTVFIMTACNGDFNLARLERYLVLAHEAGATPIILLTKIDLVENVNDLMDMALSLEPDLQVIALNTKNEEDVTPLLKFCKMGKTIALMGSSGVGKSTLVNTFSGSQEAHTQGNRKGDSKGRHTTTHRELHRLHTGAWLIDTPGMRELQLTDAADGIEDLFEDIEELVTSCKFNDCTHESEPSCAIRRGLETGEIGKLRFERWKKLKAEDELNTLSNGDKRRNAKVFTKKVKSALHAKKRKGK